jgi:hypothetical protein
MSKLTPEQREQLDEELAEANKIINLLHLQIQPTKQAIRLLESGRDAILERHGVNCGFDDLEKCESCGAYILEDDKAYRYEDGPAFCEEHAPTWKETKAQIEARIADLAENPSMADSDETREILAQTLRLCEERIAAGDGDKKTVR